MFDSYNTNANAAKRLRPIGGPWSFLSRINILAGGQILEDIDLYNRVHEMFNNFTAEGSRSNDYSEGFGYVWEGFQDPNVLNGAQRIVYHTSAKDPRGIIPDISFNPLSGLLNQCKHLPLHYMPITIELSLVIDPLDPITSNYYQ